MGRLVRARATGGDSARGDRGGRRWHVAAEGSPSRAEDQLPFAVTNDGDCNRVGQAPPSPCRPPPSSSAIVVYVAGAVTTPGVYTLDAAARVTDALDAAGGAGADADLDVVNLAAVGARRRADLRAGSAR